MDFCVQTVVDMFLLSLRVTTAFLCFMLLREVNLHGFLKVLVIFHKPGISQEEMVRVESKITTQTVTSVLLKARMKSSSPHSSPSRSGQNSSTISLNLLASELQEHLRMQSFNCTSHSYIDKARKEDWRRVCKAFP